MGAATIALRISRSSVPGRSSGAFPSPIIYRWEYAADELSCQGRDSMKNTETNPPRWADAILHCLLKPCDRDSTAGDLLEEYRAARRPSLGAVRADVWYLAQVFSILWRLIRPGALVLAAQSVILALTVFRPGLHAPHQSSLAQPTFASAAISIVWYGSVVGAPGISILDAAIIFSRAFAEFSELVSSGRLH
jgi:hypothetical protein